MKPTSKIAFYISDKRHFDYFRNVVRTLQEMGCEPVLILNDTRGRYGGTVLPEGYDDEMIELARESNCRYVISSESLKKRERFKVIVSTFAYYYKIPFGSVRVKSLLFYYLSINLTKIPLLNKILPYFNRINKRILASASQQYPLRNWVWPEHQHANYSVFFPKGLDINEDSPEGVIRELPDLFFCHGPYDQAIIKKNTGKQVVPIGYPRYDGLSDSRIIERGKIFEEFKLDSEKPLITWLPTYAKHGRNISEWFDSFRKLAEIMNVILRPHPKQMDGKRSDILSALEDSSIVIDRLAQRNMADLYGASNVVCCDYGGTIFSALYTKTPLLLLDLSDHSTIAKARKSSSDIRVRNRLYHLSVNEVAELGGLENLLQDKIFWKGQEDIQMEVRKNYFGMTVIGESSQLTAEQLIDWVNNL